MPESVIAGIDIGGTKTAVVLSRKLPDTAWRSEFPTRPELGPEQAIAQMTAMLQGVVAGPAGYRVERIGVSCGGPLDRKRGVILGPPNLLTWSDVPIVEILSRTFGVPCFLENDANAGALAERAFGAGRGSRNMAFLTMGTGLGAGLILDGELYRGATDSAGEIGHVRLTRRGPAGYGKMGSVEGWASGAGLAKVAQERIGRAGTRSVLAGRAALTARDVANAAQLGDRLAQRLLRDTGRRLGEAMAILIDVLNLDCIVVGGLAVRLGDALLGPAREVVSREALSHLAQACLIVPGGLGERLGDVAALCVGAAERPLDADSMAQVDVKERA